MASSGRETILQTKHIEILMAPAVPRGNLNLQSHENPASKQLCTACRLGAQIETVEHEQGAKQFVHTVKRKEILYSIYIKESLTTL